MAGKSLLQQFGWHRREYKVEKVAANFASQSGVMEGSFRKQGSSDNEPPSKKRKTEDEWEGDELWDDSMEFTQADLDDIEMQASQAITHTKPEASGSTNMPSHIAGQSHQSEGTFLKPHLSLSSSSTASSSMNGGNRLVHNISGSSVHNSSHSSSHSNSLSSHGSPHSNRRSSHSSYPGSLTGYSSTSSSSVKSGSSIENIQGHLSGSMSRLSSGSLDITGSMLSGNQSSVIEINKMKQECAALKLQLEKMKEEVCVKEGENKLLRDNLTKRDVELDTLKTEKISQIHQQNVQQTEKEKSLQTEVTRLQTQLQFKEQEERGLSDRVRELETQLKGLHAARQSTSQAFPQSQSVSPKPRKILVEERSPKGQSGFPSKKTFMAEEVSPQKKMKALQPPVDQHVKVSQSGDNMENIQVGKETKALQMKGTRRKFKVSLCVGGNMSSGSQLVGRLLNITPTSTGSISERGIVGLLNTPSTSGTLCNVQFDRDKDTSLLSPVRGRRLSDLQSFVSQIDKPDMVRLVPVDHFSMAVQGLSNLLKPWNQSNENSKSYWSIQNQMRPCDQGDASSSLTRQSDLEDAVLILPLISDYLRHYIEMLESLFETSTTSTGSNSSSSPDSFDTSSESPTGSFSMFLKSTANFANDLESLAIAALKTLHILLSCAGVRQILLDTESRQAQIGVECTDNEQNSETELPLKDISAKFTHIPRKYIIKLNLLKKVLRLSNPGTKGRLHNTKIVSTCLSILTVLANYAGDQQMTCLLPVLSEESLQNCMGTESDSDIVIHALQLFKALLRSNHVVSSLCSNTTGCVLISAYSLCSSDKWVNVPVSSKLQIANLIVESIFYLASSHKGCFTLVLESDCQCSVEVVGSIVSLLHSVLKIYKDLQSSINKHSPQIYTSQSDQNTNSLTSKLKQEEHYLTTSLKILQSGLQLLHLMSQFDSEFHTRHVLVQHKYVRLICGLTHIFRHVLNGDNESEMNALQDLWDFNQDDSELSQDSDTDEQESMDNT